jgi:hypothetical protein
MSFIDENVSPYGVFNVFVINIITTIKQRHTSIQGKKFSGQGCIIVLFELWIFSITVTIPDISIEEIYFL